MNCTMTTSNIEVVFLATGTEGAGYIVGNPHDSEDVANCAFNAKLTAGLTDVVVDKVVATAGDVDEETVTNDFVNHISPS